MATRSTILAWVILWAESLVGYSPWCRRESDKWLGTITSVINARTDEHSRDCWLWSWWGSCGRSRGEGSQPIPGRHLFLEKMYLTTSEVNWFYSNSRTNLRDFPGDPVFKNRPVNAGDTGSIPGQGRFHMAWGKWAPVMQRRSPCSRACAIRSPQTATAE